MKPKKTPAKEAAQQGLELEGLATAVANGAAVVEVVPVKDLKGRIKADAKRYDADEWNEFLRSVRVAGVLEPIQVRRSPQDGALEIVEGRHRVLALEQLKVAVVPAVVRGDVGLGAGAVMAFTLNHQRKAGTPMEEAKQFQAAVDAGLARHQVANAAGVSEGTVAARLKLLALPESLHACVGRILSVGRSEELADAFSGLPDAWRVVAEKHVAKVARDAAKKGGGFNPAYEVAQGVVAGGVAIDEGEWPKRLGWHDDKVKAFKLATRKVPRVAVGGYVLVAPEHVAALDAAAEKVLAKEAAPRKGKASPSGEAEAESAEAAAARILPGIERRMRLEAAAKTVRAMLALPPEGEYLAWLKTVRGYPAKKDVAAFYEAVGLPAGFAAALDARDDSKEAAVALWGVYMDARLRWVAQAAVLAVERAVNGFGVDEEGAAPWLGSLAAVREAAKREAAERAGRKGKRKAADVEGAEE